jgi:hypothetical protein
MSPNVEANRDYGWLAGYCRAHGIDMPTRQEAEQAVAARHGGDWRGYARSLRTRELFPPRRVPREPARVPPPAAGEAGATAGTTAPVAEHAAAPSVSAEAFAPGL